jgi:hypothetical protein
MLSRSHLFLFLACGLAGCAAEEKAREGPAVGVVRRAECRRATSRIRVDGMLDEAAWDSAQGLKDFAVFWQERKPVTATNARLLWDNSYLYFAAEMDDQDLFALTTERNGMTWEDDVFELFFKPAVDKPAYYEFQVNAQNTHLELFLPSRGAGGYRRFAPLTKDLGYEDRDRGWTVEGRIPWTAFKATGGRPAVGARWKFALCRYDYSVALERTELSSTAPLTQPDFHRYEDYGELLFVGLKE